MPLNKLVSVATDSAPTMEDKRVGLIANVPLNKLVSENVAIDGEKPPTMELGKRVGLIGLMKCDSNGPTFQSFFRNYYTSELYYIS